MIVRQKNNLVAPGLRTNQDILFDPFASSRGRCCQCAEGDMGWGFVCAIHPSSPVQLQHLAAEAQTGGSHSLGPFLYQRRSSPCGSLKYLHISRSEMRRGRKMKLQKQRKLVKWQTAPESNSDSSIKPHYLRRGGHVVTLLSVCCLLCFSHQENAKTT